MDNETIALMKQITEKSYLTLKDVEAENQITRRQAMYRIDKLNAFLKDSGVSPVAVLHTAANALEIPEETRKQIKNMLFTADSQDHYYFNKKERLDYMYLLLFLNRDYLSLQDFISALDISRSTALADIKELTQVLSEADIEVKYNRRRGYYMEGSEMEIRRVMMRQVIYTLADEKNAKLFNTFIDYYHLDSFDYSRLVITELADIHNIRFVDDRLVEFIYIFTFLKARMHSGRSASDEIAKTFSIGMLDDMKEYAFTVQLLQNYKDTENIQKADINYITAWILGISFGDVREDTKDCVIIAELVGKIMTRFESLSGSHYQNTEEIFVQLYSHFRPAYYRLIFHLPILNPLRERIQAEYQELYALVAETMKPFSVLWGEEIPADEIAYLTMHFAAIYSGKKQYNVVGRKSALVVCSNGIGSSAILFNELVDMFPELHILPPVEFSGLRKVKDPYDLIFATTYLAQQIDVDVPVISVSPVMSINERYQVMREVSLCTGESSSKRPDIDTIMKIVGRYASVNDEASLYHELIAYLSRLDQPAAHSSKKSIVTLSTMAAPYLMQFQVQASDWEEAIRLSYQPMVKHGYITEHYIEETIRSVRLDGPYVVITKHVALPHARPEAGALQMGLGITVLKKAVKFGSQNDPVRYLFCLSAINNEAHLGAMAELVDLLNDRKFYKLLDQAKDPQAICEYIAARADTRKEKQL